VSGHVEILTDLHSKRRKPEMASQYVTLRYFNHDNSCKSRPLNGAQHKNKKAKQTISDKKHKKSIVSWLSQITSM